MLLDHVDATEEVGARAIHLVQEAHSWYLVLVGLTPYSFSLGFNASHAVEDGNSTIENTEGSLDLNGEVDVTRSKTYV